MEYEGNNVPGYKTPRTVEEAYGHGARLHVPRNRAAVVGRWAVSRVVNVIEVSVAIVAVVAILILALSAIDIILDWVA